MFDSNIKPYGGSTIIIKVGKAIIKQPYGFIVGIPPIKIAYYWGWWILWLY